MKKINISVPTGGFRNFTKYIISLIIIATFSTGEGNAGSDKGKIKVVTTISTYGYLAKYIGGDRVRVTSLVAGSQDPHFVRPKLSYSEKMAEADLFIDTGLDLELWVPALEDAAGNKKIMSGSPGYVSASTGVRLLEKPVMIDRKEGGVHIYGNPHIYNCPYCIPRIAKNICIGLKRVNPQNSSYYEDNLRRFTSKFNEKLYGKKLIELLGGDVLNKMASKGKLYDFLTSQQFEGKPLIEYAGGWLKQSLPLRGRLVVAYHKNWAYFERMFGFKVMEYIEPKPGIPPTPKHVAHVIKVMKDNGIKVIVAANYYDKSKIRAIAKKVGARAVIVSISTGGEPGIKSVFDVFQNILDKLVAVASGE